MGKHVWPPAIHSKNGYDFIRVTVARKRVDIHLGPSGSDAARRKYLEAVAEIERTGAYRGASARSASPMVAELCVWWTTVVRSYYQPGSREPFQLRHLINLLVETFGPLPVGQFGPKQLRTLRAAMVRRGWCRSHVNRQCVRLKTLWRRAAEEGVVPAAAWDALRTVPALPPHSPGVKEPKPPAVATWRDVRLVIRHCSRPVRAMVLVQWFAGMRSGEVRTLRTCEVDASGDVWTYRPERHKGAWRGHGRAVVLGPRAIRVLRCWLRPDHPTHPVFPPAGSGDGRAVSQCYSATTYARAVRRAADKAGVDCNPYSLRHGARVEAARALGDDAARAFLGQRSISATMLYGKQDLATAAAVARRIG
jgi:integrase